MIIMKIAICDDEQYFVDIILEGVENHGIKDVVPNVFKGYTDPDEFFEEFKIIQYDLVFLDIELVTKNGMTMAKELKKIKSDCLIFFISGYKKYMPYSFRVNAFQFLTKPLNYEFFDEELDRAVKRYKRLNKSVTFQTSTGTKLIKTKKILYLETSYNKYKLITTQGNYYGNTKSLTQVKKDLIRYHLYQLNRSIILNFEHVDTFTTEDVVMMNEDVLHITKRKRKDFREKYYDYVGLED